MARSAFTRVQLDLLAQPELIKAAEGESPGFALRVVMLVAEAGSATGAPNTLDTAENEALADTLNRFAAASRDPEAKRVAADLERTVRCETT